MPVGAFLRRAFPSRLSSLHSPGVWLVGCAYAPLSRINIVSGSAQIPRSDAFLTRLFQRAPRKHHAALDFNSARRAFYFRHELVFVGFCRRLTARAVFDDPFHSREKFSQANRRASGGSSSRMIAVMCAPFIARYSDRAFAHAARKADLLATVCHSPSNSY